MNIFLPYEENIKKSAESLDDVRLNKQIVECWQLLDLALKEKANGAEIKAGHYHHPVYLFYKNNVEFLAYYGGECCKEYLYRFDKEHKLQSDFNRNLYEIRLFNCRCNDFLNCILPQQFVPAFIEYLTPPKFTPFYMEGSLGQSNYTRTTENVSKLFQDKLCKKWDNDKIKNRVPKWTNRKIPQFYIEWLDKEML